MGDAHIHPTQLYSSLYGLLILLFLLWLDKKYYFEGVIISVFMILYGISRFVVDFFRHYESQMFLIGNLQFNQIVSLLMLASGVVLLFYHLNRHKKKLASMGQ